MEACEHGKGQDPSTGTDQTAVDGAGALCASPWCGRLALKYATNSINTVRRRVSPIMTTWSRHSLRTLRGNRSQVAEGTTALSEVCALADTARPLRSVCNVTC